MLTFVAAGYFVQGQTIGNSPYAAYGIGDVKYDNTVDINAMGGISTAYVNDFNNKFNFDNPAANKNFGLTSFNIEATNENNYFTTDYQDTKSTKHSTYLSNISISFPLSRKVKFGLGYQPYSSKAYNIIKSETLNDESLKLNRFMGKGTLSTVQGALAYQISDNFALGFRTNFYFGKLYDIEELSFSDAELVNGFETSNIVKSFNFTAGTVYQKKFENDKKITLGASYTFGTTGNIKNHYTNSTYYYYGDDQKLQQTIIEENKSNQKNMIPEEASFGAGFGHDGKWFASSQIDYKKGEQILFLGKPFQNQDSYRISAGGWVLPNYNNFRNYFSRVIYRFGAYYEKGNLKLSPMNATSASNINEYAVTAGVTLPFSNSGINKMSSIDIGLELGKRGTTDNNLIQQTFFNLKIGLNFTDLWFRKTEYN